MNKEEIIHILSEVKDPEIPVLTISDLGILRAVEYANDLIQIQITPTYSGCPAMEIIQEDIRTELAKHGLNNVEIKQVLSPAWTSDWMSESRKTKVRGLWNCCAGYPRLFSEWRRQTGILSSLPFKKY